MQNSNLDLFWKNITSLPYFRAFLRSIEGGFYKQLELTSPILDVGIGDGHFAPTTFKNEIDEGIDPSFHDLLEAKTRKSCRHHLCADGAYLPYKGDHFPTIISNSVLEHIKDLDPVFAEINRVSSKDGMLIITVPNENFTKNLSIGLFLRKLGFKTLATNYQRFFNKISRHYHPDPVSVWRKHIERAGFDVIQSWNYFPKKSLMILEWGHIFGIPSLISKKLFGKWILIPRKWNVWPVSFWLKKHFMKNQRSEDGAYTFFICKKKNHND